MFKYVVLFFFEKETPRFDKRQVRYTFKACDNDEAKTMVDKYVKGYQDNGWILRESHMETITPI